MRRRRGGRRRRRRRAVASTTSPRCCTARASTPTSSAGSGCRSATSTGTTWDELLRRVHRPGARGRGRARRQVRRPAGRLPVGHRGAAGRRLRTTTRKVELRWVASDDCETPEGARAACWPASTRVCVPGGFGVRGIEGKLGALRCARENSIPTLGLCLGLQCMVIEYARNVAGLAGASSTEFDAETPHPVIATMAEQKRHRRGRAATWAARCGSASTRPMLAEGSLVREVYGAAYGRGAAPAPLRGQQRLPRRSSRRPAWCSPGTSPDGHLVEFVELPRDVHPYYVGHPGAPRVPVAADRAAPAVRRPGGGRGRRGRPRSRLGRACDRGRRRAPCDGRVSRAGGRRRAPRGRPGRAAPVLERDRLRGMVWDVRRDTVDLGDGRGRDARVRRAHRRGRRSWPSTTADRVLLLRQYRHPVSA